MARDINDVVVVGFGAWSDVNALPTLGFGIGSPPVGPSGVPGCEFTAPNQRLHYTAPIQRMHFTATEE